MAALVQPDLPLHAALKAMESGHRVLDSMPPHVAERLLRRLKDGSHDKSPTQLQLCLEGELTGAVYDQELWDQAQTLKECIAEPQEVPLSPAPSDDLDPGVKVKVSFKTKSKGKK